MLLVNATVLAMEQEDIECGYVRVSEGRILAVGPMSDCPKPDPDEKLLDLGGKLLLPGFIDAHSHIGLFEDGVGAEGDDINEESEPCTPHVRAIDGVNPLDRCFAEAREAGVTSVVISPGSANPVAGQICALKTSGRWADKMALAQPLAIKLSLGENPKMVYAGKNQGPYTRMATVAIIREQLHKAKRYMQELDAAAADSELDKPDYDARCEALVPLLRGEIAAHIHAHRAYDIMSAVRIAEEFQLKYTLIHCTEGYLIADILAELGAKAVCGPLICARTKPELSGLAPDNCARLIDAGVTVAVSTDYPEMPVGFLAASAAVAAAAGLDRRAALEAITINAAKAADLQARVGSIAPGKDADLVVFAEDPLSLGARPEMVFISGERVV